MYCPNRLHRCSSCYLYEELSHSYIRSDKHLYDPHAVLEPADSSLEALEVVLHQVCNKMGGRIKERSTIVQNSIR